MRELTQSEILAIIDAEIERYDTLKREAAMLGQTQTALEFITGQVALMQLKAKIWNTQNNGK